MIAHSDQVMATEARCFSCGAAYGHSPLCGINAKKIIVNATEEKIQELKQKSIVAMLQDIYKVTPESTDCDHDAIAAIPDWHRTILKVAIQMVIDREPIPADAQDIIFKIWHAVFEGKK